MRLHHRPRGIGRTLFGVALACGVGLAVLALVIFARPASPTTLPGSSFPPTHYVVINGMDFITNYSSSNPNDTNYLSASDCSVCPLTVQPGGSLSFDLNLTNTNATKTHTITGLWVQAPFSLQMTSPAFPVSLGPNQSVDLIVTVSLPSQPGYYTVAGAVDTS